MTTLKTAAGETTDRRELKDKCCEAVSVGGGGEGMGVEA